MAGRCTNCNSRLTCGCQRVTASDGKSCCKGCIGVYQKNNTKTKPVKASVSRAVNTNNSPTRVLATATQIPLSDL